MRDQRGQRGAARAARGVDRSHLEGRPDLHREVDPRLPGDRASGSSRTTASGCVPCSKPERRARAHRHRADRARGRRDRRRHAARGRRHLLRDRVPAQRVPRADGGHRPRRRCRCASSGATSRRRTSASPCPNFPNLFCLYGPGTNLAHSSSLFFHSEYQMSHAMERDPPGARVAGARAIEVRRDVHDEYAERHQREISQLVWAHPSIAHSHYKNPAGQGVHALAVADRPVLGDGRGRRTRRSTSSADPGAGGVTQMLSIRQAGRRRAP